MMETQLDLQQEKEGQRMIMEYEKMNAEMKQILEKNAGSPEMTAKFNAIWTQIKQNQAEALAIRQRRLAGTKKNGKSKQNKHSTPVKVKTQQVPTAAGTGLFSRLRGWLGGTSEPLKEQQELLLPKT